MYACVICFFFLIRRLPPRSTLHDTLFPYTTRFRSGTGTMRWRARGGTGRTGTTCVRSRAPGGVPAAAARRLRDDRSALSCLRQERTATVRGGDGTTLVVPRFKGRCQRTAGRRLCTVSSTSSAWSSSFWPSYRSSASDDLCSGLRSLGSVQERVTARIEPIEPGAEARGP